MKLSTSLLTLVLVCGVAHANNKDKADGLFKQGKKQMSEKRYSEACESFEKSMKLDPGIGTQLNIAKCYEEWGKTGRAYLAYQEAERLAKQAKDSREAKIHELVEKLDAEAPRLTIKLPKDGDADRLVVTLDDKPFTKFGEAQIVDPGPHRIEYSVGKAKKSKVVPLEPGGESEVTLDVPVEEESDPDPGTGEKPLDTKRPDPIETDDGPAPGRNLRIGGIVLGGVGVVAIGVSSYLTLSARSDYNDALAMYCNNNKNACDMTGLQLTADARSTANTATIFFVAGALAVGGGVAMYLLAPKGESADDEQALYLAPALSTQGAGLVLGGTL